MNVRYLDLPFKQLPPTKILPVHRKEPYLNTRESSQRASHTQKIPINRRRLYDSVNRNSPTTCSSSPSLPSPILDRCTPISRRPPNRRRSPPPPPSPAAPICSQGEFPAQFLSPLFPLLRSRIWVPATMLSSPSPVPRLAFRVIYSVGELQCGCFRVFPSCEANLTMSLFFVLANNRCRCRFVGRRRRTRKGGS